jgi:hypothetical protein
MGITLSLSPGMAGVGLEARCAGAPARVGIIPEIAKLEPIIFYNLIIDYILLPSINCEVLN